MVGNNQFAFVEYSSPGVSNASCRLFRHDFKTDCKGVPVPAGFCSNGHFPVVCLCIAVY